MNPVLHAIVAKVRAEKRWPDLPVFADMLRVAEGTREEVASLTRAYRQALLCGHWPQDEVGTAEEEFMASLRAFSL